MYARMGLLITGTFSNITGCLCGLRLHDSSYKAAYI
mgnify:CR=1 FL=1